MEQLNLEQEQAKVLQTLPLERLTPGDEITLQTKTQSVYRLVVLKAMEEDAVEVALSTQVKHGEVLHEEITESEAYNLLGSFYSLLEDARRKKRMHIGPNRKEIKVGYRPWLQKVGSPEEVYPSRIKEISYKPTSDIS
mgnify:CR=1 FL=1